MARQPVEGHQHLEPETRNLTFGHLVGLVIGSMVGAGVFALPSEMARGAAPAAILIAWLITGTGIICLAFVFRNLAVHCPDLPGGVYSYPRAGFGYFIGFNAAWGYWISAWVGNVTYLVILFETLGYFLDTPDSLLFGRGNTLQAIVFASLVVWFFHILLLQGLRNAAVLNMIVMLSKFAPLMIFSIAVLLAFQLDVFTLDLWGAGDPELGSIAQQVRATMMVTLWVFIGIEGASVVSGRAREARHVGVATVVGLLATLLLYMVVSIGSLGILSRPELANLANPSMAGVLEAVAGPWGAKLIYAGLMVSVLGAYLSWTILAVEIPYIAARDGTFPRFLTAENANGTPYHALWITNGLIQLGLIITLLSEGTYRSLYYVASCAVLLPYVFTSLFAIMVAVRGGANYNATLFARLRHLVVALVATVYGAWLIYGAGMDYLFLCAALYAPGIFFYHRARQEQGQITFRGLELPLAMGLAITAVTAILMMANGLIGPF